MISPQNYNTSTSESVTALHVNPEFSRHPERSEGPMDLEILEG